VFSPFSTLIKFIDLNPALKLLISRIQESDNDFWLVGGCLRNSLLGLPQVDIDIACFGDPTQLTQLWSAEVAGHWFWLDSKRKQSRVLLADGLTVDFAPLRAPSIIEDLQLRDFTINAFALPLDLSFPDSELIDPLDGVSHLHANKLHSCSAQSFSDDPLRMLKGIRHAVTLEVDLVADTLEQIACSAHLLAPVAGERIREELGKILDDENVVRGVELLVDTGLLAVIFGPAGSDCDSMKAVAAISQLKTKLQDIGLTTGNNLSSGVKSEQLSDRAIFLFARLLKCYSPTDLPDLLHNRLRFSRNLQHLLVQLQAEPDLKFFSLVATIEGQRRQALLVEQLEPFAGEKMVFWGVCSNLFTFERVVELNSAFTAEQQLGRIPDLLNGRLISTFLTNSQSRTIGVWHLRLKLAEINGEIETVRDAENWLKNKLSFDNHET